MADIEAKDFFGERLYIGDTVGYTSFEGSQLGKGTVVAITPKMVRIKPSTYTYSSRTDGTILRNHDYVIKNLSNVIL